ncbi:MAG TPA: transferase [Streptosporangiaceae bacterium]|nr:transferase [Streptosporangiaceae bacterium]
MELACRACRQQDGSLVLDLGGQPACDYFPSTADPGPDPVYPLQMWLCAQCGLAQLAADPTVPQEPRATEPAALIAQAADAVNRVGAAGLLPAGARVAEYGSPHGGSWLELLRHKGLVPVGDGEPASVIVDCFGLMHEPDQVGALADRLDRLTDGGVLLLQYHALDTIIRLGQWNALRHGHYAYYSTTALAAMLAAQGFEPFAAWKFELYGGTVLLAARRSEFGTDGPGVVDTDGQVGAQGLRAEGPGGEAQELVAQLLAEAEGLVAQLLAEDAKVGVCDPGALLGLEDDARATAAGLRDWLLAERAAGRNVLGYGAASRAVALLCEAKIDRSLLPAIVDASPSKHGLRMPGTDIPVVGPDRLTTSRPDSVLLFVSDLRAEVSAAFPEIEAAGGHWVDADSLAGRPI